MPALTTGTYRRYCIQSISLRGSVGDGPIVGATVTIKDAKGKILSSSVSDASANYSISIKAPGNAYPVTLEATGGTDIVTNTSPDFTLLSAALSSFPQARQSEPVYHAHYQYRTQHAWRIDIRIMSVSPIRPS
jgi:hypothetical protein